MMRILAALFALLCVGCFSKQTVEDGMYTAGNCAVATTIACSVQAIGGCLAPSIEEPGDSWELYAGCLWDRGKTCQLQGLARCALAGAVEAAGFPVIMGGAPCDLEVVKACIDEARIESKTEAVKSVAFCYRRICTEGYSE